MVEDAWLKIIGIVFRVLRIGKKKIELGLWVVDLYA